MKKSPCFVCDYKFIDKNSEVCVKCDKRVEYVMGLNDSAPGSPNTSGPYRVWA